MLKEEAERLRKLMASETKPHAKTESLAAIVEQSVTKTESLADIVEMLISSRQAHDFICQMPL